MEELGFVCSCSQGILDYNVGIKTLRDADNTRVIRSNNKYDEKTLVLFDSENSNIRAIYLDWGIDLLWQDLLASNSFHIPYQNINGEDRVFDVWEYLIERLGANRFQEIMSVVYTLFAEKTLEERRGLITRLAESSFINFFAESCINEEYRNTLAQENIDCYQSLCTAVVTSSIKLSDNVFRYYFDIVSHLPISITAEAFCAFLKRNHYSMWPLIPRAYDVYGGFSDSLKKGFINYLSGFIWDISVFINDNLELTNLSTTLQDDPTYRDNRIKSGCIKNGTIDKYLALLNYGIIRGIDHTCVRDAINCETSDYAKLSVLKKYVNRGFKLSDAISSVERSNYRTLLSSFKSWAFTELVSPKISENSWDSIELHKRFGNPPVNNVSDNPVLPIIRRLLFWEQVKVLAQPDSIIEEMGLTDEVKKTIQSLGRTTTNQDWEFLFEEDLEKQLYQIIENGQNEGCFHDLINNFQIFGAPAQNAIKHYFLEHIKLLLQDSVLNAILSEPGLFDDEVITRGIFDYLSEDAAAALQLVRYYPSFNERWKGSFLRVVHNHNYSPSQLINSDFAKTAGRDDYFRTQYPEGFNPRENIGNGSLEEYVTLYNSRIIKDRLFIISRICEENRPDILPRLRWNYDTVRGTLLSAQENLSILKDFEKIVSQQPLNQDIVLQLAKRCLYDEWLFILVENNHTEKFLIELIEKRSNANPDCVSIETLMRCCQYRDEVFRLMCKHPSFKLDKSRLEWLSEIYLSAAPQNKRLVIESLIEHHRYWQSILSFFEKNPDGNQEFREALQDAAIKKLISILNNKGIKYLYHFTDKRNYESIQKNGLMSYQEIYDKRIDCVRGGDDMSIRRDEETGSDAYVHLSFCPDTAMGFKNRQNNLYFRIKPEILLSVKDNQDFVKFTRYNAARNNTELENLSSLFIDCVACTKRLCNCTDEDKVNRQAEILVKSVPIEFIENVAEPLRDQQIYR